MTAIYPSVSLKTQQREIKDIADSEFVYITENGRGKYIFTSEEVMKRHIEDAIEDALYEHRLAEALRESRKDFEEGRYYTSRAELWAAVEDERSKNATT